MQETGEVEAPPIVVSARQLKAEEASEDDNADGSEASATKDADSSDSDDASGVLPSQYTLSSSPHMGSSHVAPSCAPLLLVHCLVAF